MDTFTWKDGERTVRFGRGTVDDRRRAASATGYVLLTTARARGAGARRVEERAGEVLDVPAGLVDEIAAELLPGVPARAPARRRSSRSAAAA